MPEDTHSLTFEVPPYRLRPLSLDDADVMHRLINDWEVVRMLSRLSFPYPKELADKWITATQEEQASGRSYHFAITQAHDGTFIGCIGVQIKTESHGTRVGYLGYWIGRPYWGHRAARLSAERITRWALAHLDITCLRARAAQDNTVSLHILERIGFHPIATGSQVFLARKAEIPVITFEITRADLDLSQNISRNTQLKTQSRQLILVVAAALIDCHNRVLLARRPEGKTMAGLWEFPGGKIEPRETPERALTRELLEELSIDISHACLAPFTFTSYPYPDFDLLMPLYLCRYWNGTPTPREGQKLAWVEAHSLRDYAMPEADLPFIPLLQAIL